MGCDIHLAVEVRNDRGRWKRALPPEEARDPYLVQRAAEEAAKPDGWDFYARRAPVTWYDDRNYDLFAMLANVRNGRGFAGTDTGDGFAFISEPKGLPDDVSREVRVLHDGDGPEDDIWLGDHSHSWLTVAELDAFDWQKITTHRGIVSLETFAAREAAGETGCPEDWCGGISGPRVTVLSENEARTRLRRGGIATADNDSVHVRISWTETYAESAGRFYSDVLPALRLLGKPDDVRIVFGFDS